MLKLGIIGTGWISSSFVEAAHMTKQYRLEAVFSRSLASGLSFSEDYAEVSLYEDLDEFLTHDLDIIYIASPNAIHFSQAKAAILAGKNIIVEKPAFSNPTELSEIIALAEEEKVLFFEAARNIHETSFEIINNFLANKTVIGADFTYSKYSSKMPALLRGELPNKFNPKFSGGLLADLGVYLLYAAIYWFGKPEDAHYDAVVLPSGVDIAGIGSLDYKNFKVAIKCAGNLTSYLPSEIYTTDGTLILDGVNAIKKAKFVKFDGGTENIKITAAKHNLYDEALHFAEILNTANTMSSQYLYKDLQSLAKDVAATSYTMRQSAGIHFTADKD
ncbi:Gfo/Idh/MocA family protein [Lactococcus nasutitermitis]|uniref:Gfo/Idh/MocA family protein n=1 Tax=Lactococcus nasutitermitis TaxID=1652957 RepID=A0ABV9JDX4_9LACT|nr:Gfo/Idh/MocA family oxidoreductase [Lactococcus nasutitermitis]